MEKDNKELDIIQKTLSSFNDGDLKPTHVINIKCQKKDGFYCGMAYLGISCGDKICVTEEIPIEEFRKK